jgi:hypothetical protein
MSTAPNPVSCLRLDPVAYFQQPELVSNIFQGITKPSDWLQCSLVNKNWKQVNEERNPRKILVRAIDGNQFEVVVELLDQGLSPKFRIAGTRFVADAEDTPYLRAKSLYHDKIAAVLKQKDGTFSEEWIKKKLDCLRFDLADYPFSVQGEVFQQKGTEGVGHAFHHDYLIPDIIESLKAFFAQRPETPHWNRAKAKQLLTALEQSRELCPSCSPEELNVVLDNCNPNELILFSDTSTYKHTHWISFAIKNSYYAFGNRGEGCLPYSGTMVRKSVPYLTFEQIKAIQHKHENCKHRVCRYHKCRGAFNYSWFYLRCSEQRESSCSRWSAEAGGILGGISVILCGDYEKKLSIKQKTEIELKKIHDISLSIFQEWIEFDHERSLKNIMNDANLAHDQNLYARFLSSLQTTSQVALNFYHFLASLGPIPWFGFDHKDKMPCDYVPLTQDGKRDFSSLDNLFLIEVSKAQEQYNSDDEDFWNVIISMVNNRIMRGFDVQNGTILAYAEFGDLLVDSYTLLRLSYNTLSKECAIIVTNPIKERYKTCNICICFLRAWYSQVVKISRNNILEVHLHSSKLQPFFQELAETCSSNEDLSTKYFEPLIGVAMLKHITWAHKENIYTQHLWNYLLNYR